MNKEFIPYEQALELKKLEFDEPCFGYYVSFTDNKEIPFKLIQLQSEKEHFKWVDNVCHAPTFSQAFRWFRDKKMLGEIRPIDNWDVWGFTIHMKDMTSPFFLAHSSIYTEYKTYEEAELACLKKLIEIVKNK
jgi:hypothetical protein